jgi:osmoprotectant transport system ATP-binding protein
VSETASSGAAGSGAAHGSTAADDAATTRTTSGATIHLDNLTKRYPGNPNPAVDNVSMDIKAGETVIFVGPSGCGKSTTLKMINRLIEPTSGRIRINDEDVTDIDPVKLRRKIGYAIQSSGLFPHMTVAENIALVPRMVGWSKSKVKDRVEEMLDLVGLDPREFHGRYPRALSGGQQQRVGVARALAADPPVLLMDEPFGAVDPITRGNLQDELLRLQTELKKTIVFVTHDFDEAVKLGDKIAVLGNQSTILQYDTPDAILANPADDTVAGFVGAGASLKQLTLLRVRDVELRQDALTADIDETPASVRQRLSEQNRHFALVLDKRKRPKRWVHARQLATASSLASAGNELRDIVTLQSTLQDALEAMLAEGGGVPVTGARGEFVGVIELDTVIDTIRKLREEHADDHAGGESA